jgi:transporter family-2 protein
MTSIVALGLLGQSIASILFDHFGLFGIEKRKIHKSSIVGYAAALIGIIVMLDHSASDSVVAIVLTFLAGCNVVLSRTINSKLSLQTSPLIGSLINHAVGLPICVIFFLLLQRSCVITNVSSDPWKYLGGTLGVMTVLLLNITVPRISAFRLTLLSFIGQIFTGILLDLILNVNQSSRTFAGGLIIGAGLMANMAFEKWRPDGIKSK